MFYVESQEIMENINGTAPNVKRMSYDVDVTRPINFPDFKTL